MTIRCVRGSRMRVMLEEHESHSQKHSIARQGLSSWGSPRSPPRESSGHDLISNSKSFPSCKYRKPVEHSGLAHFEITFADKPGHASQGERT